MLGKEKGGIWNREGERDCQIVRDCNRDTLHREDSTKACVMFQSLSRLPVVVSTWLLKVVSEIE